MNGALLAPSHHEVSSDNVATGLLSSPFRPAPGAEDWDWDDWESDQKDQEREEDHLELSHFLGFFGDPPPPFASNFGLCFVTRYSLLWLQGATVPLCTSIQTIWTGRDGNASDRVRLRQRVKPVEKF